MRWRNVLLLFGGILLVSGCTDFFMICSLNPFYLDKNVTIVPEIEGNWTARPIHAKPGTQKDENNDVWRMADTASVWKIARRISKDKVKKPDGRDSVAINLQNYYVVTLKGNGNDSALFQFKMVLFTVDHALYADFMPMEKTGLDKSRMAIESYFTIHTLARVNMADHQPRFSWLGATYMQEMIEKKRVRVSYRWVSDAKRLMLTASSEQLTGMIEHYAGESRFIDWENQQAMLKLNRVN